MARKRGGRSRSDRSPNVARQKSLTQGEVAAQANTQIFLREFNPDYDQILLRLSVEATQGLKNGSPPGRVGR